MSERPRVDIRRLRAEDLALMHALLSVFGDAPAIALYTKLGTREDVLHFDIPASRGGDGG